MPHARPFRHNSSPEIAPPFAVVVDPLGDVLLVRERAEQEVVQHGVVQHDDSGRVERPRVDTLVQPVVAQMIEMDIGFSGGSRHWPRRCSARFRVSA